MCRRRFCQNFEANKEKYENRELCKPQRNRTMQTYTSLCFCFHSITNFSFPSPHSSKWWTRCVRIISVALLYDFFCFTLSCLTDRHWNHMLKSLLNFFYFDLFFLQLGLFLQLKEDIWVSVISTQPSTIN